MHATPIAPALEVIEAAVLPDGESYFTTTCPDYDAYKKLPAGATLGGLEFGLTGWNSDRGIAYYKAGKKFATGR